MHDLPSLDPELYQSMLFLKVRYTVPIAIFYCIIMSISISSLSNHVLRHVKLWLSLQIITLLELDHWCFLKEAYNVALQPVDSPSLIFMSIQGRTGGTALDILLAGCSLLQHYDGDWSQLAAYFVVTHNEYGEQTEVELIPGGRDIQVTGDNVIKYIHLVAHHRLNTQVILLHKSSCFMVLIHQRVVSSIKSSFFVHQCFVLQDL